MWTPSAYCDTLFQTEDEITSEIREKYNYDRAHEMALQNAKGLEKIAVQARHTMLVSHQKVKGPDVHRLMVLQMPTCAGVAEIVYSKLFRTDRSHALWKKCQDALDEGVFEEMAKEMGIVRQKRRLLDQFLPLVETAKQLSPPSLRSGSSPSVPEGQAAAAGLLRPPGSPPALEAIAAKARGQTDPDTGRRIPTPASSYRSGATSSFHRSGSRPMPTLDEDTQGDNNPMAA